MRVNSKCLTPVKVVNTDELLKGRAAAMLQLFCAMIEQPQKSDFPRPPDPIDSPPPDIKPVPPPDIPPPAGPPDIPPPRGPERPQPI
jgi:hypothetical protein